METQGKVKAVNSIEKELTLSPSALPLIHRPIHPIGQAHVLEHMLFAFLFLTFLFPPNILLQWQYYPFPFLFPPPTPTLPIFFSHFSLDGWQRGSWNWFVWPHVRVHGLKSFQGSFSLRLIISFAGWIEQVESYVLLFVSAFSEDWGKQMIWDFFPPLGFLTVEEDKALGLLYSTLIATI